MHCDFTLNSYLLTMSQPNAIQTTTTTEDDSHDLVPSDPPSANHKERSAKSPRTRSRKKGARRRSKTPSSPSLVRPRKKSKSHQFADDDLSIDDRSNLSPKFSSHHGRKRLRQSKQSKDGHDQKRRNRMFYGDRYSTSAVGRVQSAYKIKEKIGSGTFSTVRRGVRRSDGEEVAIKMMRKTELNATERRVIEREIGVMQQLRHRHVR